MRVYNVKLIPNELFINYFFISKKEKFEVLGLGKTVPDFACHSMHFFIFYACFFILLLLTIIFVFL